MPKVDGLDNALPKRRLSKGADAEDGLRQKTDLAHGNNILLAVATWRRAIILMLMICLSILAFYDSWSLSYHFFVSIF